MANAHFASSFRSRAGKDGSIDGQYFAEKALIIQCCWYPDSAEHLCSSSTMHRYFTVNAIGTVERSAQNSWILVANWHPGSLRSVIVSAGRSDSVATAWEVGQA